MNEVKKPKKPLIFYYGIVLLVVILFNSIFMPMFLERQVKEVDYGTFHDHDGGKQHRSGGYSDKPDCVY